MGIEVTREQLQAAGQDPVRVTDPETNQAYVVLRADVYQEMQAHLDGELDMFAVARLVDQVMAEDDASDPHLESYRQERKPA